MKLCIDVGVGGGPMLVLPYVAGSVARQGVDIAGVAGWPSTFDTRARCRFQLFSTPVAF